MIKQIFAIYDSKAKAFSDPIFLPNQAIAERSFKIAANDPTSYLSQSPQDYTLFSLGEWNLESSQFQLHDTPQAIGLASTYKDTDK